ncbi:hypothetical protein BH10PSE13_BH10PSE13_25390 [soil metagenome]
MWAAIFVVLPILVAALSVTPFTHPIRSPASGVADRAVLRPPSPPPAVEPVEVLKIAPKEAVEINSAIAFSTAPNPAARAFHFAGAPGAEERAVDCLAAAQYYEAGDDGPGQRAVAQVILNRLRHPAFPKSVCGVVFQGSDRTTGCQFTFTCDGALARIPSQAAWERSRTLARQMLEGTVDARVGYATHYHTNWIVPYWSSSLDKITSVGTHLFFRWKGWWGTPPAFHRALLGPEPAIVKLASLSPAHRAAAALGPLEGSALVNPLSPDFSDLSQPAVPIGSDSVGDRFSVGTMTAVNSTGDAIAILFDRGTAPAAFEQFARQMCGGRKKCRILGWTRRADVPNAFPIDDETLATMSFAYMRATDAGLERALYNCKEYKDIPQSRCMRERIPLAPIAAPAAAPPRIGTEVVRITP